MELTHSLQRRLAPAVIAIVASASLAACGSSAPGSTYASASHPDSGVAFAACVRSHGVPDYPDVRAGQSVNLYKLNESEQVAELAVQKCDAAQPADNDQFGPVLTSDQMAQVRAGFVAMAKCMRAHGLDYPDPVVTPGPGGHGIQVGWPLAEQRAHPIDYTSPAYKAANPICSKLETATEPPSLRKAAAKL
jgi:hypothetical protein